MRPSRERELSAVPPRRRRPRRRLVSDGAAPSADGTRTTPARPVAAVPRGQGSRLALAALAATALTGALGHRAVTLAVGTASGWDLAAWTAPGAVRVEDVVGLVATLVGAALGGWFALGLALAAACAATRSAGRAWLAGERLVAVAAPGAVRRALAVSAGTGVALAGAALPAVALAPPDDLGWSVTSAGAAAPPVVPPTAPAPAMPAVSPPAPAPAAPVTAPVATAPEGAAAGPTSTTTVVVDAGDTLWGIAREHLPVSATVADVAVAWPAWYAANADVIGPDPDHIRPGQRLATPRTDPVDGGDR